MNNIPASEKQNDKALPKLILHRGYTGTLANLEELKNNSNFLKILGDRGILLLEENSVKTGGFGIVVSCRSSTVVKISSLRTLLGITDSNSFFEDIYNNRNDDAKMMECAKYKAILNHESWSYNCIDPGRKKFLANPFMIPIYLNGNENNIYDYILCVHLPCYIPLDEKMKKFKKTDALIMIRDVLECLEKSHTEELIHRDVKAENIMYDEILRKYVLIDWDSALSPGNNPLTKAYTEIYVDPERHEIPDLNTPQHDLYSLGVLMVFLAHRSGYFKTKSISDFHSKVCPQNKTGEHKILPANITEGKKPEDYYDIARNAMEHRYTSATAMKEAVEKILDETSERENNPLDRFLSKEIPVNPLFGILAVAVIIAFTFLFSGSGFTEMFKTAEDKTSATTIYLLLACFLIPALAIFIANGGKNLTFEIPVSSAIILSGSFLAIFLLSFFVLTFADTPITLSATCISFMASVIICLIANKLPAKSIFLNYVLCSVLAGLFSGVCIALCISAEAVYFLKLLLSASALGCICGIWIWFIRLLWHTRLKDR